MKKIVIQWPDGRYHRFGFDAPDTKVVDPLEAHDRSGLLYERDANPFKDEGAVLVEFEITATPTGRTSDGDLYVMQNGMSVLADADLPSGGEEDDDGT